MLKFRKEDRIYLGQSLEVFMSDLSQGSYEYLKFLNDNTWNDFTELEKISGVHTKNRENLTLTLA